jgi:hypothetical protein
MPRLHVIARAFSGRRIATVAAMPAPCQFQNNTLKECSFFSR